MTATCFNDNETSFEQSHKTAPCAGHGSKLFDGSAAENLLKSLALISAYREEEFNAFKSGEAAEAEVGLPDKLNFAHDTPPLRQNLAYLCIVSFGSRSKQTDEEPQVEISLRLASLSG